MNDSTIRLIEGIVIQARLDEALDPEAAAWLGLVRGRRTHAPLDPAQRRSLLARLRARQLA